MFPNIYFSATHSFLCMQLPKYITYYVLVFRLFSSVCFVCHFSVENEGRDNIPFPFACTSCYMIHFSRAGTFAPIKVHSKVFIYISNFCFQLWLEVERPNSEVFPPPTTPDDQKLRGQNTAGCLWEPKKTWLAKDASSLLNIIYQDMLV